MKIVVATALTPHIYNTELEAGSTLVEKLKEYGHQAELLKLPVDDGYDKMMEQMLGFRMYHIEDAVDRLICIRRPAHLLKHSDKHIWFTGFYRPAYEKEGLDDDMTHETMQSNAIREYIMRADAAAFSEAKKVYAMSVGLKESFKTYTGNDSEILYMPLHAAEQYRCDAYGDYILVVGTINRENGAALAIEAMKHTKTGVRLVFVGDFESIEAERSVQAAIKNGGLENKIEILQQDGEEAIESYAKCLAVCALQTAEDIYSLPALAGCYSSKPTIALNECAGVAELIGDGQCGLLVKNDANALAEAFDKLFEDKALAERLGQAARGRIGELGISWDDVIGRFTA